MLKISGLDWTVIRATMLTNEPGNGVAKDWAAR